MWMIPKFLSPSETSPLSSSLEYVIADFMPLLGRAVVIRPSGVSAVEAGTPFPVSRAPPPAVFC